MPHPVNRPLEPLLQRCTGPLLRRAAPLAALLVAGLAGAAAPAQTIKPGLWQVTNKMTSANPEMDQAMSALLRQMGNLPPEQRKMMADLAAKQGVSMPNVGADGAIGMEACITPEMAARKQIPTGQPGNCKSSNVATADGMNLAFTCSNPASKGEGKLRLIGDDAFTMSMNVTTSARGKPEQMQVETAGKWLGASCPAR
jgi:hypothetical protein